MADNPLFDEGLYHGAVPIDPRYPPTQLKAAQTPSAAGSGPDGESPSGDAGSDAAARAEAVAPSYGDETVEQLREEMRRRELSYAGLNKAALVAALEASDETSG